VRSFDLVIDRFADIVQKTGRFIVCGSYPVSDASIPATCATSTE